MFTFFWQVHRSSHFQTRKLSNSALSFFLFFFFLLFFLCWSSCLCRGSICWLLASPLCWNSTRSTAPPAGARRHRRARQARLGLWTAGPQPWGAPLPRGRGGKGGREARGRAPTLLLGAATQPTPSTTTPTEAEPHATRESKQPSSSVETITYSCKCGLCTSHTDTFTCVHLF